MTEAIKRNIKEINPIKDFRKVAPVYSDLDDARKRLGVDSETDNQTLTDWLYTVHQDEQRYNSQDPEYSEDYYDFIKEYNPTGPFQNNIEFVKYFSKKNPELLTMDDFEVAEAAYKKLNESLVISTGEGEDIEEHTTSRRSKINYPNFLEEFLVRSRDDDDVNKVPGSPTEFLDSPMDLNPGYSTKDIALRYGVSPATYEGYKEAAFASSLGEMTDDKMAAVKSVLNSSFGQDVKVYYGDKTGELEFINPKTNQSQLVNPPGLDFGDFTGQTGNAIVMVPDALGAMTGLLLYSNPITAGITSGIVAGAEADFESKVGTTAVGTLAGTAGFLGAAITPGLAQAAGMALGSGYGSAMGEATRIYLGNKLYGINKQEKYDPASNKNIDAEYESWVATLKERGNFDTMAALATAGGMGLEKIFKIIKWTATKRRIDPEILKLVDKDKLANARQLMADINETLELNDIKSKLKFSLGEALNNPKLLRRQLGYEGNDRFGLQGRFDTFNQENADAVKAYMEIEAKNLGLDDFRGRSPAHKEKIGKMIQKVIDDRLQPRKKIAVDAMTEAETNLTNQAIRLGNGDTKQAGMEISSIIKGMYKDQRKKIADEYGALFNAGKGRTITLTDKGPVAEEYLKLKTKLEKNDVPVEKIKDLLKNPLRDTGGGEGVKSLDDIKQTITSLIRREDDFYNVPGYPKDLIEAYEKELKTQLSSNDQWLKDYSRLSKKYKRFNGKFGGVLSKIVKIGDGTVKIGDEDVFKQIFKKGAQNLARTDVDLTYNVLEKNPAAMQKMLDAMESKYRREVVDTDGKINIGKHNKFMDEEEGYGYALKKFFGERDFNRIKAQGDLSSVHQFKKAKAEKLIKNIEKTTKGQLSSKQPSQVFDYLMDKNNPTQATKIMNILKNEPAIKKEIQNHMHDTMYNMILNKRGKITLKSWKDLDKFLDKKDGFGLTLRSVFNDEAGKKYIKNLEKVKQTLEIMTRKYDTPGTGKDIMSLPQHAIDLARGLVFRPLSREGKMFTGFLKWTNLAMDEIMADVLTQPDLLEHYLKAKGSPFRSKKFKDAMGYALGVPIKLDYEMGPDDAEEAEIRRTNPPPDQPLLDENKLEPLSEVETPTVDMFAMEQAPQLTDPASVPPPPIEQPQPAGISSLPQDRAQQYAGLFPNDPSGQMIAQQGNQDA